MAMTAAGLLQYSVASLPDLLRAHATEPPGRVAIADERESITCAEFDRLIDRWQRRCSATAPRVRQ